MCTTLCIVHTLRVHQTWQAGKFSRNWVSIGKTPGNSVFSIAMLQFDYQRVQTSVDSLFRLRMDKRAMGISGRGAWMLACGSTKKLRSQKALDPHFAHANHCCYDYPHLK